MDPPTRQLIEALHRSPVKYVLAVTGGGTGAAAMLLNVPGGSRTVLEVIVPYGEQALNDFLGQPPETYCSTETARAMALRAHTRATWLAPRDSVLGIGCTASLATDRPKKGDHRCHVAVYDGQRTISHSLTLTKGARAREDEEAIVDAVLLNTLAEALCVSDRVSLPLLPGEQLVGRLSNPAAPWPDWKSGLREDDGVPVCVLPDGQWRPDAPKPALLLPGSFNPVHAGHWGLADAAARLAGCPVAFEISIANVDKPPLPCEEVTYRLAQFAWRAPVWLTRAPTFAEKAALFPGTTFVVGSDTAARIAEPRYYQDSPARMTEALQNIRAHGCRFLVAGRVDASGRFHGCRDLPILAEFRDLFTGIPESEFRLDISSTELRAAQR